MDNSARGREMAGLLRVHPECPSDSDELDDPFSSKRALWITLPGGEKWPGYGFTRNAPSARWPAIRSVQVTVQYPARSLRATGISSSNFPFVRE